MSVTKQAVIFAVVILALITLYAFRSYIFIPASTYSPSLIQLLVNGQAYDGRRVAIEGYVTLWPSSRSDRLFLHCDDLVGGASANILYLQLNEFEVPEDRAGELDRRFVSIIGRYDHPLTLKDVEHIELWSNEQGQPFCHGDGTIGLE